MLYAAALVNPDDWGSQHDLRSLSRGGASSRAVQGCSTACCKAYNAWSNMMILALDKALSIMLRYVQCLVQCGTGGRNARHA